MPRYRRPRHLERLGELACRHLAILEQLLDDGEACRVGKGAEDRYVEPYFQFLLINDSGQIQTLVKRRSPTLPGRPPLPFAGRNTRQIRHDCHDCASARFGAGVFIVIEL